MVPIRLSDQERGQIAAAAGRLGKTLGGFVREAALQASAVVERKASVASRAESDPEREPLVIGEPEREHYVDGEPVSRGG